MIEGMQLMASLKSNITQTAHFLFLVEHAPHLPSPSHFLDIASGGQPQFTALKL